VASQIGDSRLEFVVDDYNRIYLNRLYELMASCRPITEVWRDGANPKSSADGRADGSRGGRS